MSSQTNWHGNAESPKEKLVSSSSSDYRSSDSGGDRDSKVKGTEEDEIQA